MRLARRRRGHPGSVARRRCAAARHAISVSAAVRMTISPGLWPRSTAWAPSSIRPGWATRRCIGAPWSALQGGGDGRAVEATPTDDDKPARPLLAFAPRPVEIMLHSRPHPLHDLAQRLPRRVEKAFDAQHVMRGDDLAEEGGERDGVAHRP